MSRDTDVTARIREDILAGALAFGARVTIADLAERYAVSQMPIRMALSQLQGEGLLAVTDTGRTSIRTVDRSFVSNIFDIRGAMEVLLVRAAADKITAAELESLAAAERELEEMVERQDYAGVQRCNRRFHSIIAQAADNKEAVETLDRYFFLVAALWRRVSYGAERFSGVVNDHQFILRALQARDRDAAVLLTQAHVVKAKLVMLEHFDRAFGESAAPARRKRQGRDTTPARQPSHVA